MELAVGVLLFELSKISLGNTVEGRDPKRILLVKRKGSMYVCCALMTVHVTYTHVYRGMGICVGLCVCLCTAANCSLPPSWDGGRG